MLGEDEIRDRLVHHQVVPAIPLDKYRWRRAAVLVPLLKLDDEWHILFTRRTEVVAEHKGQVAFPGGAADAVDATLEDTALRESQEEIGLPHETVKILGRLPDFYTITNFLITPVVGTIRWPFEVCVSPDEVDRVFTIPLSWLVNRDHWDVRPLDRDGVLFEVVYYKPYDGEILWGATARITLTFLEIMGLV
jgi:8-oxo-dGTP pyrophosphatase MutT (NUDIX family)